MIATETERLISDYYLSDNYDDFFGNKKKRQARQAKRKARRAERQKKRELARNERRKKGSSFLKDVGDVYRDIGGATAIGGIIDSFTIDKDKNTNNSQSLAQSVPSDFEFSVGSSEQTTAHAEDKKSIPTVVYVVGGVIVIGIIGLLVISSQKKKQLPIH